MKAPRFILSGGGTGGHIYPAVAIANEPGPLTIDFPAQTVRTRSGLCWRFEIDDEAKAMLVGGLDAIDLTSLRRGAIEAFRSADRARRPWVYLA